MVSEVFLIRVTALNDEAREKYMDAVSDHLNEVFDDLQAEVEEMVDTEVFEVSVEGKEELR